MSSQYYSEEKIIPDDLCDQAGNMNLVDMINRMIEISTNHFNMSQDGDIFKNTLWVLLSWDIEIVDIPVKGKKYKFGTELLGYSSFLFARRYSIKDGDREIVKAYSIWTIIDPLTRRVMRIPKDSREGIKKLKKREFDNYRPKISDLEDKGISYDLEIEPSDIDGNLHVNNTVYLKWFFEKLNRKINFNRIKILYLKEILAQEEIEIIIDFSEDFNKAEFKEKKTGERKAMLEIYHDNSQKTSI
ncbi:MAG: thioesterase [Tissierellia bacterium]|nr:thioesterase [Tissierellia bacterium]